MQLQQFRRLALLIGCASLIGGGLVVVACGTDNGASTTSVPGKDSGKPNNNGDDDDDKKGDDDDDDATTEDGGTTKDGSAGNCQYAPKLRDNSKGFYCDFLNRPDGSTSPAGNKGKFCDNGETCCNPAKKADGGFADTFCATSQGENACKTYAESNTKDWPADNSTAKSYSSAWECADKSSCGGDGNVCCLYTATSFTDPKDVVNIGDSQDKDLQGCGAKQAFKAGGTHCVKGNACPTAGVGGKPEIKLCSLSDQNCAAGTTCTPFAQFYSRDFGYCK